MSESREGEGETRRAHSQFYTSREREAIPIARRNERWLARAGKMHFFLSCLLYDFFFLVVVASIKF